MIQTLKAIIILSPARPYLDYALWLNHLVFCELLFFGLQWLMCYWLVWIGIFFSVVFCEANPALVAAKGWLILDMVSISAVALWVFDCAARMRRGTYTRKESLDGSPS